MNYYLIDYENTGENGLKGITELDDKSCTIIFYSENADKISFDMHQKLCSCKTGIEYRKINTGKKNALDFQLSTYLGYLIAKGDQDQFYIVSKDNGYRVVMDFWKNKKVRQIDCISRAFAKPLMIETKKPPNDNTGTDKPISEPNEWQNLQETPAPFGQTQPETERPENLPLPAASFPSELPSSNITDETSSVCQKSVSESCPDASPDVSLKETHVNPDNLTASAPEEPEQKPKYSRRTGRKKKTPSSKQNDEFQPSEELKTALSQVIEGKEEREQIGRLIVKYKTKQGVNNAIVKLYGTEKAGELYKKIKPLLQDKKGK